MHFENVDIHTGVRGVELNGFARKMINQARVIVEASMPMTSWGFWFMDIYNRNPTLKISERQPALVSNLFLSLSDRFSNLYLASVTFQYFSNFSDRLFK